LFSYHTKIVGHNHISEVFPPKYKPVVNIHGYYRIRQYCLQPGDYETDNEAELIEESFGSDNENEF